MPQPPKSRARELQRAVRDDLDTLQRVPQEVAELLGELRRDRERLRRSRDLTAEAKTRHARSFRETAVLRLEALIEEAERAHESVIEEAQRAFDRPDTEDPTQQLLRELQLQRAWARAQRLLKSGATIPDVIARAAKNRDSATFDALRAEMEGWLLEHGADRSELEATNALLAEHEDVVLPPDKLTAKQVREAADEHTYYGTMAINQAREELGGGPKWSEVPAGPEGTIAVPDQA